MRPLMAACSNPQAQHLLLTFASCAPGLPQVASVNRIPKMDYFMPSPTLHLYTDSSPNGFKISIALEELELPYQLHHVRIAEGEH